MGFIYPWMLWGLVGLVPLVIAWSLLRARRDVLMERFAVRETWPVLNRTVSQNARFHKGVILLLALIFSIVAAARPYWGAREREVQARGVNVIFAVDVSRSMAATDILPDRLTSAKRVVRQVLPELPGNRVGLIPLRGRGVPPVPADHRLQHHPGRPAAARLRRCFLPGDEHPRGHHHRGERPSSVRAAATARS
jgi:hypothetical protein